jgi:hypothetical protein
VAAATSACCSASCSACMALTTTAMNRSKLVKAAIRMKGRKKVYGQEIQVGETPFDRHR